MTSIRRIYAYLMTFAGLTLVAVAAANLAQTLIYALLQPPQATNAGAIRDSVAQYAAAALVGLPLWLVHWTWIRRTTARDPAERASALRRLFLYAVVAGCMLVLAGSLRDALTGTFELVVGVNQGLPLARAILGPLPFALTGAVVWLGHWRVLNGDRVLVGETGASATLRRWYLFGLAFVGAIGLLTGLAGFVEGLWRGLSTPGVPFAATLPAPAATALVSLGVWLVHWRVLPSRLPAAAHTEDGVSVLRAVYLFLLLGVAVVGTLFGASQLLYYAVARALGVDQPGGLGGNLLQAAAGPASALLVYGAAWAYQRAAVQAQARAFAEAPRQAGVRRLYTYLVALAGLAVLAIGVAGLLWTLADIFVAGTNATTWREQVALFATLAIVGLPVWLIHWRASVAVSAAEAHSLARRLYLYVSLIVAVLALIGAVGATLYRLINVALGASFDTSVALDVTHAIAVAVVAGTVAVYHWRVIRADSARGPADVPANAPRRATVRIEADDEASLSRALDALRAIGVRVSLR